MKDLKIRICAFSFLLFLLFLFLLSLRFLFSFFSTWDFTLSGICPTFSGITCSSLGHVTTLTLCNGISDSPGLAGSLPPSIFWSRLLSLLTNLQTVDLRNNRLHPTASQCSRFSFSPPTTSPTAFPPCYPNSSILTSVTIDSLASSLSLSPPRSTTSPSSEMTWMDPSLFLPPTSPLLYSTPPHHPLTPSRSRASPALLPMCPAATSFDPSPSVSSPLSPSSHHRRRRLLLVWTGSSLWWWQCGREGCSGVGSELGKEEEKERDGRGWLRNTAAASAEGRRRKEIKEEKEEGQKKKKKTFGTFLKKLLMRGSKEFENAH